MAVKQLLHNGPKGLMLGVLMFEFKISNSPHQLCYCIQHYVQYLMLYSKVQNSCCIQLNCAMLCMGKNKCFPLDLHRQPLHNLEHEVRFPLFELEYTHTHLINSNCIKKNAFQKIPTVFYLMCVGFLRAGSYHLHWKNKKSAILTSNTGCKEKQSVGSSFYARKREESTEEQKCNALHDLQY